MPRVSIIIPAYNMARFLKEAVDSALGQTFRDTEIILIDDGSTDNTPELAATFPSEVRYYRQANSGLSSVRNKGIELAHGEYIIFLDSDDILFPDALEKSVAFLDAQPKAGFCHGQYCTIDVNSHPMRLRRPRGPKKTCVRDGKEEITQLLFTDFHSAIHPSTTLIRLACFEKVGLYDTKLKVSEDVDMWFRLAKCYDVGHLAVPVAKVRFHPQSITAKSGVDIVKNAHLAVLESVLADESLGPIFSDRRKKAYFGLYCLCARVAARTGHRDIGLQYLWRAFKVYPSILWEFSGLSLLLKSTKDFVPWQIRRAIMMTLVSVRLR